MTKIVLKFLLLLFVPFFAQARDTDSLRVLWVGNSYTYYNDMPPPSGRSPRRRR